MLQVETYHGAHLAATYQVLVSASVHLYFTPDRCGPNSSVASFSQTSPAPRYLSEKAVQRENNKSNPIWSKSFVVFFPPHYCHCQEVFLQLPGEKGGTARGGPARKFRLDSAAMPATGKQDIPKWVAVSAGICCYRPRHRFLLEGEMCGEEVDLTKPVLGSLTVQQSHLPLQSVDLVLHRYNYLALARQAYIAMQTA